MAAIQRFGEVHSLRQPLEIMLRVFGDVFLLFTLEGGRHHQHDRVGLLREIVEIVSIGLDCLCHRALHQSICLRFRLVNSKCVPLRF